MTLHHFEKIWQALGLPGFSSVVNFKLLLTSAIACTGPDSHGRRRREKGRKGRRGKEKKEKVKKEK